ncbi:hypothetical protein BDV06DRAFT_231136 [Aspergillus oleicola]
MSTPLLHNWLKALSLPRISNRTWHLSRLSEELAERAAAETPLARLSETADILFTLSRAKHDGAPIQLRFYTCFYSNHHLQSQSKPRSQVLGIGLRGGLPWSKPYNILAKCYMLGKFTSRWSFYRVAALCAGKREWRGVREVVNPRKQSKVAEVAGRHGIEKGKFGTVCGQLLWVFPVLP